MKYTIDIEANGLTNDVTKIWMIVCKEYNTENYVVFADQAGHKPLKDFGAWCDSNVTEIIWHNGIRYDAVVIEKILGYAIPDKIKQIDTMVVSKLEEFPRSETNRRHGLAAFGELFGDAKIDFDSAKFAQGDDPEIFEEMLVYCKQDVKLNEKVFQYLAGKVKKRIETKPIFKEALRVEHELSKNSAKQISNGWAFDFTRCQELIDEITGKMAEIEKEIEPNLKEITRFIDTEPKKPQYKRDGTYTAVSARVIGEYLGRLVNPDEALLSEPPMKPGEEFQRSQVIPANMGNQDVVKDYVETLGVTWTEWNWKKINGKFLRTSAKFNDKDLLKVDHQHTKMIAKYYTLRNRRSVMTGWMEQRYDPDGRIHGDVNDMGAASFRQTHKVLANIPSDKADYGKEIRELFVVPDNKTIISADGASYQIRIAAHYLKSKEYTDKVINGDAHQAHADMAGVTRNEAKGLFFGILFGAGVAKVSQMLDVPQADGKKIRQKLIDTIPNFRALMDKAQMHTRNHGWIPGLDGRKVYPGDDYKALNYLIQSAEAILMKATIVMIAEEFKKINLNFKQLLFYHDEVSYEIYKEDVPKAEEIIRRCFKEAPKKYGVQLMEAGDVKTGSNYFEVH